jgi:hypothetical protein
LQASPIESQRPAIMAPLLGRETGQKGFLPHGLPFKQRLQIVLKLGGVSKSFCLCSGLESPLFCPLPELLPIESGLGLRRVELAPQRTATPGGVTICFIRTIRRMSAEDFDFHLVPLFGL